MEAETVVEATAIIWVWRVGFWHSGYLLGRVLGTDTCGREGTEVGVGREKCRAATTASADPMGSSGARTALQSCPGLGWDNEA